MNTKKGLLALLAVGFAALLFGGFVAALDVGTTVTATTSTPVAVSDKVILNKSDVRVIPYGDDVINTNSRRIAIARLSNIGEIRDITRLRVASLDNDARVDFRASIARVRAAIAEYRQSPSRDDFKGFSLTRLLGASGLTQEQQDALKTIYMDSKDAGRVTKMNFTLSAPGDDFVAVGKFSATSTGDNMGGTLVGFSNMTNKRFFGIWGNGTIVGVSDGKVFWGSYWVDDSTERAQTMFELHNFGSERVIEGNAFIY